MRFSVPVREVGDMDVAVDVDVAVAVVDSVVVFVVDCADGDGNGYVIGNGRQPFARATCCGRMSL